MQGRANTGEDIIHTTAQLITESGHLEVYVIFKILMLLVTILSKIDVGVSHSGRNYKIADV